MDKVQVFLDLPISTMILLAAGYLSYRIAFVGRNDSHSAVDTVFIATAFAALAKCVLALALWLPVPFQYEHLVRPAGLVAGTLTSIVSAFLWRNCIESWLFEALQRRDWLNADRHRTAWLSYLSRPPKVQLTQLYVRLKDGTCLLCDELHKFSDFPFGSCVLGEDGSVLMYPTDRKETPAAEWEPIAPPSKENMEY